MEYKYDNKIICGDCIKIMAQLPENFVDAIVTDPPYGFSFMGKEWDKFGTNLQKYQEWTRQWAKQAFRVLKPGGHMLIFGGTRTYHRMTCGIEDTGFEIRDCMMWIFSTGFPKSLDISKAIDKLKKAKREKTGESQKFGRCDSGIYQMNVNNPPKMKFNCYDKPATPEAKQWDGWGTTLKPAYEPIVVARKPLSENNVAMNVLRWGTGGLNIDGCRIETTDVLSFGSRNIGNGIIYNTCKPTTEGKQNQYGRFPSNIMFECICDEVVNNQHTNPDCPCHILDKQSGVRKSSGIKNRDSQKDTQDVGGASRFFYCAKASTSERNMGLKNADAKIDCDRNPECYSANVPFNRIRRLQLNRSGKINHHPTVKPIKLMEYLVKLVTPPDGIVLDPFAGSGSTLIACKKLGFRYIGIEQEAEYVEIANKRLKSIPDTLF